MARGFLSASGALAVLLALSSSCSRQTVTVRLHPLQASGDITYVCRDPQGQGRPLVDCNPASISRGEVDLYALVTQVATGEVAVINVPTSPASIRSGEGIVDVDPSVPGYGFLHVGALPGRIVSTPGGALSIVGVAEAGKPGLYGLPTQCIGAPSTNPNATLSGTDRDLTLWPACSLPVAPGSIAVVVAPESDTLCDGSPTGRDSSAQQDCYANLANEGGPKGRRKIVVSLPEPHLLPDGSVRASLAVIDAEWFAQGAPGDFSACRIEAEVPLKVDLPGMPPAQVLPEDLTGWTPPVPPPPSATPPDARPAGFALHENTLYVADSNAPVIHVVDFANPCAPLEKEPLLTRSLERPDLPVTTSRIAVSPLTPTGRQFVYAIDQYDSPASIMAFDVSPGSTDRTPIVRPGTPLLPSETADRIKFQSPARDISFIERDRPVIDPATGNVVEGLACDPTPGNTGIGTEYRSASEYSSGARAVELRGVFATALLTNGQVAIIDVEDYDAPCRRPVSTNTDPSQEDFRGCKADPPLSTEGGLFLDANGFRTVTGEVSCRMVQPHRARAAALGLTDPTRGIHAPSLRAFPQLRVPDSAQQLTNEEKPKLLGVDFTLLPASAGANTENRGAAQVYVGTAAYGTQLVNQLDIAPATAERHSLVLPFNEPRAYAPTDTLSLTYEGPLTEILPAGFVRVNAPNQPFKEGSLTLNDPSIAFCDRGVHDEELMREVAHDRFGITDEDAQQSFAAAHSDYITLMGQFPVASDAYWKGADASCGRDACIRTFGDYDPKLPNKELSRSRDFRIVDAYHQWLELEPRPDPNANTPADADEAAKAELARMATCCFPSGAAYVIRASQQWVLRGTSSGLRHKVRGVWDESVRQVDCAFDDNPRRRYFESRVFETCVMSNTGDARACKPNVDLCGIADPNLGVRAGDSAEACVYSSPTARFAVYRGARPSVRDMGFAWQTVGGFSAMRLDFSTLSPQVSPNALFGLPEMNWLTVVDGSSLGVVLLSLDRLAPLSPPLN